ncbi:MAG: hypothetical protein GC160_25520 [Acidobacteria bacterium]|nr:hypothetical protein [Acidobacteriota bacterium]
MKRTFLLAASLCCSAFLPPGSQAAPSFQPSLLFEQNLGQAPTEARFVARGPAVRAAFTPDRAVLRLTPRSKPAETITLRFLDGSSAVRISGDDRRIEKRNYLRASGAVSDIPTFGRIRYENLYPGVDLVFYEKAGRLEYDYILQPGASLELVRFEVSGAATIEADGGALRILGENTEILQQAPRAFQGGSEVPVEYVSLGSNRFGFRVEDHDPDAELVIDPVVDYSSYLGAGDDDFANAVAVGEDGAAYLTGRTDSSDFVVSSGALLPQFGGDEADAFVTKFDAGGSQILWSTFYGSESTDFANDIAVNSAGEVYITGWTESQNLPVDGFQTEYAGNADCFVAKLNPDGASLAFATYLGHGDEDSCNAIALDDAGAAFVAGYTKSVDFPVSDGSYQSNKSSGRDAFVVKLSANGGGFAWGSFVGGIGDDTANDLTIDANGVIYLVGDTTSTDFPVTDDAYQNILSGGRDAFLTKLNADGAGIAYSSLFGGAAEDLALGVTLGPQGDIYFVGEAGSADLPRTIEPIQNVFGGGDSDAFVAMFDPTGRLPMLATFLGGDGRDFANDVVVDESGRIFLAGATDSSNFSLTENAVLPEYRGKLDAFVAQWEGAGVGVLHSSYYGGENDDEARGLALSSDGRLYVAGYTRSNNFPLTDDAYQNTFNEDDLNPLEDPPAEAFLVRVSPSEGEAAFTTVSSASFRPGAVTAGSIVTGFGTDLAAQDESATALPLPTNLGGIEVRLVDQFDNETPAEIFFVSSGQVNFLVPEGLAPERYEVEVVKNGAVVSRGFVQVGAVAPGLFSADMSGSGPAAALIAQRSGTTVTNDPIFMQNAQGGVDLVAIDVSSADESVLELFGTGISGATDVQALVDGRSAPVLFAGPQGEFVGLDQVNVQLPGDFAGAGEVTVQLVADGVASNAVRILLQ